MNYVQNKQVDRVYLFFRCLNKYCLQRITTVSLEKKVLFGHFLSFKVYFLIEAFAFIV